MTAPNAIEKVRHRNPSYIAFITVKWAAIHRQFLKKRNMQLPHNPADTLLGIYTIEVKFDFYTKIRA